MKHPMLFTIFILVIVTVGMVGPYFFGLTYGRRPVGPTLPPPGTPGHRYFVAYEYGSDRARRSGSGHSEFTLSLPLADMNDVVLIAKGIAETVFPEMPDVKVILTFWQELPGRKDGTR